eukprot:CAMPEP_0114423148 /NCGR_PEP_ID=MMETSP0103-20121206/5993_1 /TAXON_ID=37642 ORGANISM="Paraphysomonas imperforata, Strain PA2" /NCGR_SAMPLE_ID=MMETSP0103 /ASSEMBLY_ACC=CAM_ASM_000201 /LENGTH=181 /DNA_ID=CAMNT_0001591789 /DNA_START=630 /DNA_END=1178 /DNA_ORIENTATION=+
MKITNPGVKLLLWRMLLYPMLFLLTLIPATLTLITQFAMDKSFLALNSMSGFFISFNGFMFNMVYFYHQKQFPPIVMDTLLLMGWLPTIVVQEPLLNDQLTLTHDTNDTLSDDEEDGDAFSSDAVGLLVTPSALTVGNGTINSYTFSDSDPHSEEEARLIGRSFRTRTYSSDTMRSHDISL